MPAATALQTETKAFSGRDMNSSGRAPRPVESAASHLKGTRGDEARHGRRLEAMGVMGRGASNKGGGDGHAGYSCQKRPFWRP